LKTLFVSAEVSPFAKVGGLADVAGSLPKALRKLGIDARVVMPLYAMIERDPRWDLEVVAADVPIAINGHWLEHARILTTVHEGVPIYFIGHSRFFQSATSSDRIYTPGIDQYLFFSSACLELPQEVGWKPDVVHCNDWHTGFVPVLMREKFASRFSSTGAAFTIHNLAYQGEFGVEILDALALPRSLFVPELLETWGGVNFLKAGCVYSDQVNTVSPNYAREIQTPAYGCTLEGLMKHLADEDRLTGILNGIDPDAFNPETDPFLPAHYSAEKPDGKSKCRKALLAAVGLDPLPATPIIGAVTRLSHQKGLDLLAAVAPNLFEIPVQLIVQGLGDPAIIADLRSLQLRYPDRIRFVEKFDEDLARLIYSGSDMFAMPSLFEPCGLGQLIAMRFGTIPIVRATGGLADTVTEGRNGFLFREKKEVDLFAAVARAAAVYRNSRAWKRLVRQAMAEDHGWDRSAAEYVNLYGRAAESTGGMLKLA